MVDRVHGTGDGGVASLHLGRDQSTLGQDGKAVDCVLEGVAEIKEGLTKLAFAPEYEDYGQEPEFLAAESEM